LAKQDEISSTEKLLELIRNNKRTQDLGPSAPQKIDPKEPISSRTKSSVKKRSTPSRKSATVGVDIGYEDLKLVKIHNASNQNHELLDYLRVPFETDIHPRHPDFYKFLKKNLNRFCGSQKNLEIWSCISSARVELRYLRIPKVPQKQLSNAIYWSHKKVAPYNDEGAIFDFEILGDVVEGGSTKTEVVSFTAPQKEILFHKDLFGKSGFPLKGITIVPFSFQNMLRSKWIPSKVNTISCLYIGRDWSRIDIYSGNNLVLSRGIKAGIKTMNEAMRGEIVELESDNALEILPEMLEPSKSAQRKSTPSRPKFDTEKAQKIFFGLIHDISPKEEETTQLQPEEEEIFRMVLPALKRLVQQVERTFDHYASNFSDRRVEKIYISSTVRPHRRIVDYIGDELGLPREIFDPFVTDPDFIDDVSLPSSEAERGSYAPAIGMALSSNSQTPNFLFTYKEKDKDARSRLINKITMVAAFILLGLCIGLYGWQNHIIDQKLFEISRLQSKLSSFQIPVDQKAILNLVDKNKEKNTEFREFSRKYLGMVVLTEISNITPSNVRLNSIYVLLDSDSAKGGKTSASKNLILEGIILGERTTLEATLAGYLIQLSGSPLFTQPVINQKEPGLFMDKEVLRFTAQLKLT
jgi:Tfp pilus assembly PilM family ATPase